mmetsp:Transcript_47204/g.135257  ORF Transcript_47204/g.135257 Transcript_47204/m.135257 type:complete len:354 (-) Transcript_47204:31-1092(-)
MWTSTQRLASRQHAGVATVQPRAGDVAEISYSASRLLKLVMWKPAQRFTRRGHVGAAVLQPRAGDVAEVSDVSSILVKLVMWSPAQSFARRGHAGTAGAQPLASNVAEVSNVTAVLLELVVGPIVGRACGSRGEEGTPLAQPRTRHLPEVGDDESAGLPQEVGGHLLRGVRPEEGVAMSTGGTSRGTPRGAPRLSAGAPALALPVVGLGRPAVRGGRKKRRRGALVQPLKRHSSQLATLPVPAVGHPLRRENPKLSRKSISRGLSHKAVRLQRLRRARLQGGTAIPLPRSRRGLLCPCAPGARAAVAPRAVRRERRGRRLLLLTLIMAGLAWAAGRRLGLGLGPPPRAPGRPR